MKRLTPWVFCLFFLLAGTLSAGEMKTIELTDGSVLSGEVLSLTNGVYTIRTQSMGTITLPDSKISSIRSRDAGSSSINASQVDAGNVQALTQKMMSNQEIMSMIDSLKDDPDFANVLQDPEIMNAIKNGDTVSLMANPKFLKIMNNATVKDIQNKVAQ